MHKDLSNKLRKNIFYYSIKAKYLPKNKNNSQSKKPQLVKDYQKIKRLKLLEDSGQKILGLSTNNKRIKS